MEKIVVQSRRLKKISGEMTFYGFLALTLLALQGGQETQAGLASQFISPPTSQIAKLHVPFISNRGQINEGIKFYAKTLGGTVFITDTGEILYSLHGFVNAKDSFSKSIFKGVVFEERLMGGKIDNVEGEEETITTVTYIKGNDASKWMSKIPSYALVSLGEVYDGVELKLKAYGNMVEKLFFVKPGADPEKIWLRLNGAKGLKVNESGELVAETHMGTVNFTKPLAYQEQDDKKKYVGVAYAIREDKYGFKVDEYDKTKRLIIDPMLASTFVGGASNDGINSMFRDGSGNLYVAGWTRSLEFPATPSAYNRIHHGYSDAFVSMFDDDLKNLIASTIIGGDSGEEIHAISTDDRGNLYVAGNTWSSDFPTTTGAFDSTHNGSSDVFVIKLDANLQNLLASTLLGGGNEEEPYSVGLNSNGNIYVAGQTTSSDFPSTSGAYDGTYNNGPSQFPYVDGFVAKLDGDLQNLLASTYFGGSVNDWLKSMSVDSSGNIYVAGSTGSSDFPTTTGAYNTTYTAYYISKLDGNLQNLLASTFFGGQSTSIIIDENEDVYVAGDTGYSNFPTTTGAYDMEFNGGGRDAFVSKFDTDLKNLIASTLLGGDDWDEIHSMAMDDAGNVYVAGSTKSSDFPTTEGAFNRTHNGYNDGFITKLDSDLQNLLVSTFVGGDSYDAINSILYSPTGEVYVAGLTESSDFPATINGYDPTHNGSYDAFVLKLDTQLIADANASVSPKSHYFGKVPIDNKSAKIFTTTNSGGVDLVIASISITGNDASDFSVVNDYCSGQTLSPSPSDECTLKVIFTPKSEGAKNAFLSISYNNPVSPILHVPLTGWGGTEPVKGLLDLPETGQKTCFAAWDDGALQNGASWPEPRFKDNGDGTITDNLTGLMWLKNGDCFGSKSWQEAIDTIADLNAHPGNYGCSGYTASYADWRLPNLNELESLVNLEEKNITKWLNKQGFAGLQEDDYWSSTSSGEDHAWTVDMQYGDIRGNLGKGGGYYFLPVRGETALPARVGRTGQGTSYAAGDDGDLQKGVSWPEPRFTDYGDGTVTDNLTGLMWLKDAGCIGHHPWQEGIDEIAEFNSNPDSYNCEDYKASYSDWYLPNRKELRSLLNYGISDSGFVDWLNSQGFSNVPIGYLSSTTSAKNTGDYWTVWFSTGLIASDSKTTGRYVWPVRHDRVSPYLSQPNVFGIKVGNSWVYQGQSYTAEDEVVSFDQDTFPSIPTYLMKESEDGYTTAKSWYEMTSNQLKLWGVREGDGGDMTKFSAGLVVAWYPMYVNDHEFTSATAETTGYPGIVLNVSMTVDVLSKEVMNLAFGALQAYKLRYRLRIWGYGHDETDTSYQWVVPYLGTVKHQDAEDLENLTAFSIGCGTITQETDVDIDGLKDYEEFIVYDTDWQDADADRDSLKDGQEISLGTDPKSDDTDKDGLKDGWEVAYSLDPAATDDAQQDPDGDQLTNLAEQDRGTKPNDPDTDSDGLNDGYEVAYGFDPVTTNNASVDPDGDGLSNSEERDHHTNPLMADTDNDGLEDADEIGRGTNPINDDTDGDGLMDCWEVTYGFDPIATDNALQDPDGDGLNNLQEQGYGVNPFLADTDQDGCGDKAELLGGRDPNLHDPQGDLNADCALDLRDALIALKVTSRIDSPPSIDLEADVNGDGKCGLEETIYILKNISRLE